MVIPACKDKDLPNALRSQLSRALGYPLKMSRLKNQKRASQAVVALESSLLPSKTHKIGLLCGSGQTEDELLANSLSFEFI